MLVVAAVVMVEAVVVAVVMVVRLVVLVGRNSKGRSIVIITHQCYQSYYVCDGSVHVKY